MSKELIEVARFKCACGRDLVLNRDDYYTNETALGLMISRVNSNGYSMLCGCGRKCGFNNKGEGYEIK